MSVVIYFGQSIYCHCRLFIVIANYGVDGKECATDILINIIISDSGFGSLSLSLSLSLYLHKLSRTLGFVKAFVYIGCFDSSKYFLRTLRKYILKL